MLLHCVELVELPLDDCLERIFEMLGNVSRVVFVPDEVEFKKSREVKVVDCDILNADAVVIW